MEEKSAEGWQTRMGWRYVAYGERDAWLSLQIEPMVGVPDIVYVPSEAIWSRSAPAWAQQRRAEILDRLKSVPWNRKLTWQESATGSISSSPNPSAEVPGSLESTPIGRLIERMRLFKPGGRIPHRLSHRLWEFLARQFAAGARGEVNIFTREGIIPDSVFERIELPALRSNPHVLLNIRQVSDDENADD